MSKLKTVFGDKRIIALAGEKDSGKTNNLLYLIKEFREDGNKTPIFSFGLPEQVQEYANTLGVKEISSLSQLIKKRDCIIILDEFQKLKLNDRRFKDQLDEVIDFVYHHNVYLILSSPNIREFNSIIGSIIEGWLLKDVKLSSCVNGSQLKEVVDNYKGKCKCLGAISVEKSEILVANDKEEVVVICDYVIEADSKKNRKELF